MTLIKKCIIAGLIIYTLFYLIESYIIISYPYQISYPEGFILNQAYLINQGKSIYKGIDDYPFIITNYPVIYPYLCALIIKMTGISFVSGRFITFLASILVVYVIYEILKKDTSKNIAIMSALFFIASSYIYKNSPFMRVDMLGLFFSLLGLYFFICSGERRNIFYSIPFFVLALYTKQTFIAAPLSVAFVLFSKPKKAVVFIILMVVFYVSIFLILNFLTGGEFYRHNFLYNLNIFSLRQAIKHYVWALQNHAVVVVFSVIYLILAFMDKKSNIFVNYFLLSSIIAVSVGKIGANMNYFFEMIASSCILTGLCLQRLRDEIESEKIYIYLTGTAIMVQLILWLHMPFLNEPTPTNKDWQSFRELSRVVAQTDGAIISEDAGLLVLNDKRVIFQPFELTQLANQRIWNQTGFVKDIENKHFALIILSFDVNCFVDEERLTPSMSEAIRDNYQIKQKIGDYYLYKPIMSD